MEDGSVTVRAGSGELVELNATAAALWALCDGKTAVFEIVGAASSFFAASLDEIQQDILEILSRLEDEGLICG